MCHIARGCKSTWVCSVDLGPLTCSVGAGRSMLSGMTPSVLNEKVGHEKKKTYTGLQLKLLLGEVTHS